jgi:hypothetical protein
MTNAKKYKLMDLIEEIKEVNGMINLHSSDTSAMMLAQYKYKKDKLVGYLIDELVDPKVRSPKSMFIIMRVIEKFYPDLKNEALADSNHAELNDLEAVLS